MLVLTFVFARFFVAAEAGLAMYFVSLIAFGGIVATLGLGPEITRVSALIETDGSDEGTLALLLKMCTIPLAVYIILSISLMIFKTDIPNSLQLMPLKTILLGSLLIAINKIFCAILQGLGEFKKSIIFDQIVWLSASVILTVMVFEFFKESFNTIYSLILYGIIISVLCTFFVLWSALLRRYTIDSLSLAKVFIGGFGGRHLSVRLFSSAIWLSILMSGTPFLYNFVSGLILANGDAHDLAVFQVSSKFTAVVALLPVVFNYVFAPDISRKYSKQNDHELTVLYRSARNVVFLTTIPTVILFIIFATDIMAIFGNQYSSGRGIVVVLLLGQLISTYFGSGVTFLILSNNAKLAAINSIIAIVISCSIYYLLKFFENGIDPVFMILIFQFLWNWLCCLGVSKNLDIDVFYIPSVVAARRSICSIIV